MTCFELLPGANCRLFVQVLCPVCREPIQCDMNLLSSAAPPLEVENARQFELSDELRSLQRQMAALFSHQKRRGGIIDPEAEDSKLLLVTDTAVSDSSNGSFVFVLHCEEVWVASSES